MARKINFRKPITKGTAIVGDGLCEKLYFDQMKTFEKLPSNIEPKLPKTGAWNTVFDTVEKLLKNEEYTQIYCLIDFDTVISQNAFEKYANRKHKILKTHKVTVYECNPCFEFWYLMHFEKTSRTFSNCDNVADYLKKYLGDYAKTEEYYIKKLIYEHLKPNQPKAVENAQFLEQNREDFSVQYPRAEVYKLIEELICK